VSISEAQIKAIYSPPNTVNIYTGGITYVGENHVEYDFNSFTGCAGAVVFLLDKNQPSSVQQCDYEKAIAIHSGASFPCKQELWFYDSPTPCIQLKVMRVGELITQN
jgi:hypothetical protein